MKSYRPCSDATLSDAYGHVVSAPNMSQHAAASEKARRRAARELVGAYHQQELRRLLEHVRGGFAQLDADEIDEFELDELIHRYKRAVAKLWSFCGSSGGQWLHAADTLTYLRDRDEPPPDWWAQAAPRRNR